MLLERLNVVKELEDERAIQEHKALGYVEVPEKKTDTRRKKESE